MFYYERKLKRLGYEIIIGVDEVGRGCLAGPILAVAVVLKTDRFFQRIDDSKKLTFLQREKAFPELLKKTEFAVGLIDANTIDKLNIQRANALAMEMAVRDLLRKLKPHNKRLCVLIDGKIKLNLDIPCFNVVRADSCSKTVACASIIAKVLRDRLMKGYHFFYPQYGFIKHKGYPTQEHKQKIKDFGLSLIHRRSFSYA